MENSLWLAFTVYFLMLIYVKYRYRGIKDYPAQSWGREKFGVRMDVVAAGVDLFFSTDLKVELCSDSAGVVGEEAARVLILSLLHLAGLHRRSKGMEGPGLGVVKVGYDVFYASLPREETITIDHDMMVGPARPSQDFFLYKFLMQGRNFISVMNID
ncbi:hypothetical protein VNO80_06973 [Phaseolus coccineus]|uniref:Uncharacterized protein n=1 Tax=Phaseolus coccineus TaxID=3886 RepID=A0AAN9NMR1_PHACN